MTGRENYSGGLLRRLAAGLLAASCLGAAAAPGALAAGAGGAGGAGEPAGDASTPAGAARAIELPVGETLVYSVKYGRLSAGQATLSVEEKVEREGAEAYRTSMTVRSSRFVSLFKCIDDRASSFVAKQLPRTLGYEAVKSEGRRLTREKIGLDYEARKARTVKDRTYKGERTVRERELDLPAAGAVQDAVTWFYAIRSIEIEDGRLEFVVVSTSHVRHVKLKRAGTERLKIRRHGRLNAIKLTAPDGGEALLGKEGELSIWLEERTRIPLKISVRSGRTTVGLYLARTSGSPLDKKR